MNELYGGKDSVSKAPGLSGQLQPATVPMAALLGEIRDCNWQQYMIKRNHSRFNTTDGATSSSIIQQESLLLQYSSALTPIHTNPDKRDVSLYTGS
jgi:hypothetical protein